MIQKKHEILPLLIEVKKKLGDDLYRYRKDTEHLYIRHFFADIKFDIDFRHMKIVSEAISGKHQEGINWLLSKKNVPLDASYLLYKYEPSLMKVKSILETCQEEGIEIEDNTMYAIEDLISPLLDGLFQMMSAEQRESVEREKQLNQHVNVSIREMLEKEKMFLQ